MDDGRNISLACPACQDFRRKAYGKFNDLEIFTCRNCSSVYSPRKVVKNADYDDDYQTGSIHAEVPDFVNSRLDEIVATFESFRQYNRFLDIGCGAGSFLQAARRANWEIQGTEVSLSAVEMLRKDNIDVFHGILQEAAYPSESFDVVVASHVLEHIPEPREAVEEVYRILRPGGLFWVNVPQGRGISSRLLGTKWSQVEPPVHWCLFSPKGIKILLENVGFHDIQTSSSGVDPFEILHVLRKSPRGENLQTNSLPTPANFQDVKSRRRIFELLTTNAAGRLLKTSANTVLNLTNLGDFLKVQAIKK